MSGRLLSGNHDREQRTREASTQGKHTAVTIDVGHGTRLL